MNDRPPYVWRHGHTDDMIVGYDIVVRHSLDPDAPRRIVARFAHVADARDMVHGLRKMTLTWALFEPVYSCGCSDAGRSVDSTWLPALAPRV